MDDQGKVPLHVCFDKNVLRDFKPSQLKELVSTLIQTSTDALIVKLQPFGIVPGDSLHELLYARNSYRNTTIAYQAV